MNKFYKIATILAVFIILGAGMLVAESNAKEPEKTDGFVCPVLGGKAGENGKASEPHGNSPGGPIVEIGGGDYTVAGPDVEVPVHATNDEGAGTPGGDHASPGDPDYTAIWKK
jgi:hypothetical protein